MNGQQLYQWLLGIERPWRVREVVLVQDGEEAPGWHDLPAVRSGVVEVRVEHVGTALCPKCGARGAKHDGREDSWRRWYDWAVRSRLPAMVAVARMVKRHWDGIINAATTDATNAMAESINAKIQRIKRMACGYRNRERFHNDIYFHLGGLDLSPETLNRNTKG